MPLTWHANGLFQCRHRAADILSYPPAHYGGLVVLRLNSQDKLHVLRMVGRLIPVLSREEPKGHPWIVKEDRVRIRP